MNIKKVLGTGALGVGCLLTFPSTLTALAVGVGAGAVWSLFEDDEKDKKEKVNETLNANRENVKPDKEKKQMTYKSYQKYKIFKLLVEELNRCDLSDKNFSKKIDLLLTDKIIVDHDDIYIKRSNIHEFKLEVAIPNNMEFKECAIYDSQADIKTYFNKVVNLLRDKDFADKMKCYLKEDYDLIKKLKEI